MPPLPPYPRPPAAIYFSLQPLMTPDRGRFAFVPVMANATEYSNVYNSFGLLRAPWNSDPNPFLTRHDHVFGYVNNRKPSGCKQYRDAVRKDTW